jgi:dTDP-4-dehydrorhamnose reductase
MVHLAQTREFVSVVSDQWGNPTSSLDLADGIIHIARTVAKGDQRARYGTFHLAGTGFTTWCGFADHIMKYSRALGRPSADVRPIMTADYPAAVAPRPPNSMLDTTRLWETYHWQAPSWEKSCEAVVRRLSQLDM